MIKQHTKRHWAFSILPNIVRIVIAIGFYSYLVTYELFPQWIDLIYGTIKIYIALEVVLGSARSWIMPVLAIGIGAFGLYIINTNITHLFSIADCWQLIIAGAIGFLLSLFV